MCRLNFDDDSLKKRKIENNERGLVICGYKSAYFLTFCVRSTLLTSHYFFLNLILLCSFILSNCYCCTGGLYGTWAFCFINYLCYLSECIAGMYGAVCENNCNQFCQNNYCNKTTGFCLNGCRSGYLGNICNQSKSRYMYPSLFLSLFVSISFFSFQSNVIKMILNLLMCSFVLTLNWILACGKGKYGINCSQTCGHCFNNTACHHENGTCQQGCAAGYKTHKCNTSKRYTYTGC